MPIREWLTMTLPLHLASDSHEVSPRCTSRSGSHPIALETSETGLGAFRSDPAIEFPISTFSPPVARYGSGKTSVAIYSERLLPKPTTADGAQRRGTDTNSAVFPEAEKYTTAPAGPTRAIRVSL
jgi:hypothetical protein